MSTKLLSIAIPTWNRQDIIGNSLAKLLPQVAEFKDDIQLIISDNASGDNTAPVISKLLAGYTDLEAIFFRQKENTGYYGNFRKCRELSTGKYFWLLSDNEVLLEGRLGYLINALKRNDDVGIVFLKNGQEKPGLENHVLSYKDLFCEENYKLTFISACLMLNIKDQDNRIFNEFKGNSYLGFALLLSVKTYSDEALVISGEIYQSIPAVVSFNVFKCWTYDIFQCFAFIENERLFEPGAVEKMKERIITCVLKDHMLHYRIYNSFYGKDLGSFEENFSLLKSYYGHTDSFKEITAIRNSSRLQLIYRRIKNKVFKKLQKWEVILSS